MAHDLYIKGKKAAMMYIGELPWHGLGQRLDKPATSAAAIKAAGLDWTVRKVPLFARHNGSEAPVKGHYGIVPTDQWGGPRCPVFGVVGKDYRIMQNVDAFSFFDSIVGEGTAVYHTAGALGQGERVWILARLDGLMEVTPADALEKYILLSTGHDGRSSLRVLLTPVRVVCQNTLTMAFSNGQGLANIHHTRDMDTRLVTARERIRSVLQGFDGLQSAYRGMARHKLTDDQAKGYFARILPEPNTAEENQPLFRWVTEDRDNCYHLFHDGKGNKEPSVRGTLWAAYNGVTEYVDHWRQRGRSSHMDAVCFGGGYRLKARAFDVAVKMVSEFGRN